MAWSCADFDAHTSHPWLGVLREPGFVSRLGFEHLLLDGVSDMELAFGVRLGDADFAYPCVGLRWDGRRWTGGLSTPFRWRSGQGIRLMDQLWKDIARRTQGASSFPAPRCAFTWDFSVGAGMKGMTWEIEPELGGPPLVRLRMLGSAPPGDAWVVEATSPPWLPFAPHLRIRDWEAMHSARVALAGGWFPSEWSSLADYPWLRLVPDTSSWGACETTRFIDGRLFRLPSFGVVLGEEGVAIPCIGLTGSGRTWVGLLALGTAENATRGDHIMMRMRAEIERRVPAQMLPLQCRFGVDNEESPSVLEWEIGSSWGGPPVVQVRMQRFPLGPSEPPPAASTPDDASSRPQDMRDLHDSDVAFWLLMRLGPLAPSSPISAVQRPWLRGMLSAGLKLRFFQTALRIEGAQVPMRVFAGLDFDDATPSGLCVDLRSAGLAWFGMLMPEGACGHSLCAGIVRDLWQEVRNVADAGALAPVRCSLTLESSSEVTFAVASLARASPIISLRLRALGPWGTYDASGLPGTSDSLGLPAPGLKQLRRDDGALATLDSLARLGLWTLMDPEIGVECAWLRIIVWAGMQLRFVNERLIVQRARLTFRGFGAWGDERNFALPCIDLRQIGDKWLGRLTWQGLYVRGRGQNVMRHLKADLTARAYNILGVSLEQRSLWCEFGWEDASDPLGMTWAIVPSTGEAPLVKLRLRCAASPEEKQVAAAAGHGA